MEKSAECTELMAEYEELLQYCPLLETDPGLVQGLDRQTLRVLVHTARSNKAEQCDLQRRGIAQAKARGVQFGRPKAKVPANFPRIVSAWKEGIISREEAIRQSGLSTATFYRYLKKLREQD